MHLHIRRDPAVAHAGAPVRSLARRDGALLAWLAARSSGRAFIVRMEDLDRVTSSPEHERRQLADLSAIGLDWDGPVVHQSERFELYERAITRLRDAELTYECYCSRREIREAAAAPHGDAGRYPGLYLVITGTPAFYDGPQGVQRLAPLAQRLHVDFGTDRRFDNPRAVQIRLAPFDPTALLAVGRRVRDIYADGRPHEPRLRSVVDDSYLDTLARAGYRYSSSIYPIQHDHYGMPDAPRFAHQIRDGLIEVPPTTLRMFNRNLPSSGGGYFRLFPYALSRWMLKRVNQGDGQAAIFYFHPWEIDVDQPRAQRRELRPTA